MAFAGGMFNVIDRATQYLSPTKYSTYGPDKVIDYLPTFNTLSNFPDVFILTGVIGFSVLYIGVSIYHFIKEKKTKKPGGDKPKNEKNHS
jgi:lipoprotein signal peptidase